ncbi:haloacid dehalogenase [Alkalihalophilus pseudofirmus]|uniref:HAD family hydrolase n=1 Tax=Alkalihalobacterium alkalinitrilicum TaxID=427920 RepID=UPI00094C79D9|nr:HAD family hydrolase [Alkalihalobacterium alkalinitrilicum]OLO36422.1 haloacid dehalogenase [Alkalihalophilus pseudofirmus]
MAYRLLALNIDGVLLRSNARLSRQTKDAIEYVKSKGVYITLATDRPFPAAKRVAKALKLDTCLITHDGAYLASELDEPIFEKRIHEDKVFQIGEILENYTCHIRLLHERYGIGNKLRNKSQLMAKMTIGIGDPLFYPVTFVDSICDYILDNPIAPPKIQIQFLDKEQQLEAVEEIEKQVSNINVIQSQDGRISIVPEGVSRVRGLQRLGRELGIGLDEMVAIGSTEEDIDVITQVGLGVAMGNAPKSVQQIADWVTRSNNMHGVAYMVREVFRKQLKLEK